MAAMRAGSLSSLGPLLCLFIGPLGCGPTGLTPQQQWLDIKESRAKIRAKSYPPSGRTWAADNDACQERAGAVDGAAYAPTLNAELKMCLDASDAKLLAALKAEAASQNDPADREALGRVVACVDSSQREIAPGVTQRSESDVMVCFRQREEALAAVTTAHDAAFAKLEQQDSAEAWLAFIETNRNDKRAATAAKRVSALAASAPEADRAKWEERLVVAYPTALAELPVERRVLLVGPKGLRVRDLLKLKEAKVSNALIIARIKSASEPYRSFDGDEMIALKGLGFSDDAVAAMLEVTTKLEDRRRESQEREAMRAEIATLKKMIEEKKAAGSGGGSGETVQTKEGPLDVVVSCGKRLAAVNLCEQLPFPASTVCSSSAESSFPCPK